MGAHNCGSGGRWFESTQLYQSITTQTGLLSECLRSAWRLPRTVGRQIPTNAGSLVRRRGSHLLYLNAIGLSGSEATLAIVDYQADVRLHPCR